MRLSFISRVSILAILLLATLSAAASGPPPRFGIGDVPPPLQPTAWIKGQPIPGFQRGHVYVVNFFATWCGASRQSMSLMSEVARRHRGDLTVVGVNVREAERGEPTLEAVSRFVVGRPDDFDYVVAMDDPDIAPLFQRWMRGADMYAIPTAFIVGRDGKVAWIGITIDDTAPYPFEKALVDVLDGSVDLEASRKAYAGLVSQIAEYLDARSVLSEVHAAREREDHVATLAAIESVVEARPEYRQMTLHTKLSALLHVDEAQGLAFGQQELDLVADHDPDGRHGELAGSIGRTIAAHPGLSPDARIQAMRYLRMGLEAEPDGYGALLNWLSIAQLEHSRGHLELAIAAQERVVALARSAKEIPAETLDDLEQTLSEYRSQQPR